MVIWDVYIRGILVRSMWTSLYNFTTCVNLKLLWKKLKSNTCIANNHDNLSGMKQINFISRFSWPRLDLGCLSWVHWQACDQQPGSWVGLLNSARLIHMSRMACLGQQGTLPHVSPHLGYAIMVVTQINSGQMKMHNVFWW